MMARRTHSTEVSSTFPQSNRWMAFRPSTRTAVFRFTSFVNESRVSMNLEKKILSSAAEIKCAIYLYLLRKSESELTDN